MATKYVQQQVGVADGSAIPADRADGRQVNGNKTVIVASKKTNEAWNSGDKVYLGKKPAGTKPVDIKLVTDTSFGSATVDIGDATTANKYVAGATLTVTNVPTSIGPKASTVDDAPMDTDEELWATIGAANVASGVAASILIELTGVS